jgi:hypothetical protein
MGFSEPHDLVFEDRNSSCLYWASLRGISALALTAADVAGSTDQ